MFRGGKMTKRTGIVTPTLDYFNYLIYLRSLGIFIYILRDVEIKIYVIFSDFTCCGDLLYCLIK